MGQIKLPPKDIRLTQLYAQQRLLHIVCQSQELLERQRKILPLLELNLGFKVMLKTGWATLMVRLLIPLTTSSLFLAIQVPPLTSFNLAHTHLLGTLAVLHLKQGKKLPISTNNFPMPSIAQALSLAMNAVLAQTSLMKQIGFQKLAYKMPTPFALNNFPASILMLLPCTQRKPLPIPLFLKALLMLQMLTNAFATFKMHNRLFATTQLCLKMLYKVMRLNL